MTIPINVTTVEAVGWILARHVVTLENEESMLVVTVRVDQFSGRKDGPDELVRDDTVADELPADSERSGNLRLDNAAKLQ
jgi:hypothetical protein